MSINPFTEEQMYRSFITLQNYILDCNKNYKKFFIGRLSGNENVLISKVLLKQPFPQYLMNNMLYVAGIKFNDINDILKYTEMYNKSVKATTLLGVWDCDMYKQEEVHLNYLLKVYPHIKQIAAHALEPYYYMPSFRYKFNEIFKNKKVLIISSHKKTIEEQIVNLDKLYKKEIFDKTTLFKVYKPVQQNAGSNDNNSWLFHFNKMKEDIKNIKNNDFDFDIALVSAGGFGMILSEFIYSELNSSVMYIGGALQLFFGINGGRWNNNETIKNVQNKYWTNVLKEDLPKNPKLCENSSYW